MFNKIIDCIKTESTGEEINVNLYTSAMIFQILNSSVLSVGHFKADLLGRNSNLQSTEVNQLVQDYGY
jgi:hypothetical protein